MKNFALSIIAILLSSIALCQGPTLKPTIIRLDTTDLRCFYPDQYKYIVGSVSIRPDNDSIIASNNETIEYQRDLINEMKSKQLIMRSMVENQTSQLNIQEALMTAYKDDVAYNKALVKRYKKGNKILIVALGAAIVGIIVK